MVLWFCYTVKETTKINGLYLDSFGGEQPLPGEHEVEEEER